MSSELQSESLTRAVAVALFGFLLVALAASGQTVPEVSDPYQAEYFSCNDKPDGRLFNDGYSKFGYSGFRIIADLNFDGLEDVILSTSANNGGTGCGNAGCDVTIFLRQPDKTYQALRFGLH